MPSPTYNVTFLSQSIQYTGSNSADIDSQVPDVSIVSESGGVLTLLFNGNNVIVNTGNWIIWDVGGLVVFSNAQYLAERDCVALCSQVEAVAGDLATLGAVTAVRSVGMAAVPTLLLGQDTTVAVTLQPAMPDSGYAAHATKFGGVALGDLSITSVSVVDEDTVNVAVDNVGLGTISGVTLMVHAID